MRSNDNSSIVPAMTQVQPNVATDQSTTSSPRWESNLARNVYCILGIPVDAIDLATVAQRIETAVTNHTSFLISTPNLNFVVSSLSDQEFRESLLASDLCPPDGAPVIWIARLLGLPIKERAAGADLLERLQARRSMARPIAIFLFGGATGVAAAAAQKLNAQSGGLTCVGTLDPGFCEISEMSGDDIIGALNSSGADFLILALGARKGQLWLARNHDRLTMPIRSHLGAAINFQAGTITRAPQILRSWGLEWLWRIREEHYLWRRYRDDGLVFLRLLVTRVLPLAILTRWQKFMMKPAARGLLIKKQHDQGAIVIHLSGAATESFVPKAMACFQDAVNDGKDILVDLSGTCSIDARFLGLFLMLRKELKSRGAQLRFTAVPRAIKRIFHLNELGYLLSADSSHPRSDLPDRR
jgi:N-acetylglucosaminyldiphosphoundecaprenol N-acetyl-beta-D-mannosaminyltransferase